MADAGVVWQGSPFHRYLQEVGLDDGSIAVRPLKADAVTEVPVGKEAATAPSPKDPSTLATLAARIVGAPRPPSQAETARAVRAHGEAYVSIIAQTPLLLEEDLLFIMGVDENILRRKPDALLQPPAEPRTSRPESLLDSLLVFTASASLIAAPALLFLFSRGSLVAQPPSAPVRGFTVASALFLGSAAAGAVGLRLSLRRAEHARQRQHIRNLSALRGFIGAHEAEVAALGRALRLVQEVELISRGFTITVKPGPISRIESQSEARKCGRLREGLRRVLNTNLHAMRSATLALLKDFPLSQSVDFPGSYRAYLEPSQLGLCVSEDPETISADTGNLSLAYLKSLFNAVNEQRSEFLRRLALVFSEECQRFHDHFNTDEAELFPDGGDTSSLQAKEKETSELPLHEKLETTLSLYPLLAGTLSRLRSVAVWTETVLARETRFQRADGSLFGLLQPENGAASSAGLPGSRAKGGKGSAQSHPHALALPRHCVAPLDGFTASLSDISNHVQSVNAALSLCHHELRDLFSVQDEFAALAKCRAAEKAESAPLGSVSSPAQSSDSLSSQKEHQPETRIEPQPQPDNQSPDTQLPTQPQPTGGTAEAPGVSPGPCASGGSQSLLVSEEQFRRAEAVLLKYRTTIPARIGLLQDMFGESILRLEYFLQKLNPGYTPSAAEAMPLAKAAEGRDERTRGEGAVWVQDATEDVSQSKKADSQKFEAFTGRGRSDESDESESELDGLPEEVRRARLMQMRERRRIKRDQEQADELARRAAARQAQQFISELREVISGIEER